MDDFANMTPEELEEARDRLMSEIREYEGYLSYVLVEMAKLANPPPADDQDPLIFDEARYNQIYQNHADAKSYVPYIDDLNKELNRLNRYMR